MIEFKEGRYISFLVFLYGKEKRDWLAYGYRDPGDVWRASYRFRYYAKGPDQDPWNGQDKKIGFDIILDSGADVLEGKLVDTFRVITSTMIAQGFNDRIDWLDIRSNDPKRALELLSKRPWAHMKIEERV